jgi:molybdopterin synthase catalytic subunit
MQVQILLFATLKDIAGESRLTLDVRENATVDEVRRALTERYPRLDTHVRAAIASVNREFAQGGDPVRAGDEVAFFPPVSGGDESWPEIFRLPDGPIDHDEIVAAITTPATGAVCLFSGMVRGETHREGHLPQTTRLHYEAYEPMALDKMRQVAAEIRQRWPQVQGIAIAQRVGVLDVGQNTVLIACSSAHRDDGCFEAARYGIDRLKEIVPVWKQEVGADGAIWVEGSYQPTPADRARQDG